MLTRSVPTLLALGLLAMRLAADAANLVNEPGRRWFHAALLLAVGVAIVALASRRLVGWGVAFAYCAAQTIRYGIALYISSSFITFLALMVMLTCTLLLLHPDARSDFG